MIRAFAALLFIAVSAPAQQPAAQAPNPAAAPAAPASVPADLASVKVDQLSLDAGGFLDALLKVSARFRLPLGVEWVKTPDTLQPVQLSRVHTTLAEVIRTVVSIPAGYDWRDENGVVHVFQRELLDDRKNPLNVMIESFDTRPVTTAWASASLDQLVSHAVRHPDLYGISLSVLSSPEEPVFVFSADHIPARTILNQMVRLEPKSPNMKQVWITTFPAAPEYSRTGYREVVPMLNPKFVPEQPFWILLRWGDLPLENMVK